MDEHAKMKLLNNNVIDAIAHTIKADNVLCTAEIVGVLNTISILVTTRSPKQISELLDFKI